MEIVITDGTVKQAKDIETTEALHVRAIANHLPRPELIAAATIVHNLDENSTGIRFETNAGPVLLMLPVAAGFDFHLIHESETGPVILQTIKASGNGRILPPRVIAFRLSEALRTRGLK
ncbi:hypothetical protein V2W30_41430 (plasmid) [Streptomyces sp. Q6]|uniref:Uncharacterized protein n=1 Tax=Streptomyces citrinus TaxID=3118173 RepID=A0ACD5AQY7_9ACTN